MSIYSYVCVYIYKCNMMFITYMTHTQKHVQRSINSMPLCFCWVCLKLKKDSQGRFFRRDMRHEIPGPWATVGMLGHTWHPFLNVEKIGVSTFVCFRRSFGLVAIKWPCVCSQAQETSHGSVGLASTASRRGLLSAASGAQCTDKAVSIGKAMRKGSLVWFNQVQRCCLDLILTTRFYSSVVTR